MDKTLQTIDSYNYCASQFAALHFNLGIYQAYMEQFSNVLKNQARILELGCGPGNVAHFLLNQPKGYSLLGVDLSPEMLKLARQNAPSARFVLQDLRELNLTETFDAIVSSFSIIHLTDSEAWELLGKTFHWLNIGGYLYVNFMSGGVAGFEKTRFSERPIFFNYYSVERFRLTLETIGYQIISVASQDYHRSYGQTIQEFFVIAQKPVQA